MENKKIGTIISKRNVDTSVFSIGTVSTGILVLTSILLRGLLGAEQESRI